MSKKGIYIISDAIVSLNNSSINYLKKPGPLTEFYRGIKKSTDILIELINEQQIGEEKK